MKMQKAYQVKVKVVDFEEYKEAFLHIYNQFKTNKELLHFFNDYNDGIYLICEENSKTETEKYLEQFGEISTELVFVKHMFYDMNEQEWNMVYEKYNTEVYAIAHID